MNMKLPKNVGVCLFKISAEAEKKLIWLYYKLENILCWIKTFVSYSY